MRAGKLIEFSFRSILRNRMRSLLTSLGIIIGVCSVIVMVAVGEGSQRQISERIASMGTNLLLVMPPRGPREANRLTLADKEKIAAESVYAAAVSGEIRTSFEVVGGEATWSTTVMGIEEDYLAIKGWKLAEGGSFGDSEEMARAKVAVLGSTVASELFGDGDPVGRSVRIGTTPFTVIGVLASKGAGGMGEDQDDVIMVPLRTALARLSSSGTLNAIDVSVLRASLMDQAESEVEAILMESHRLASMDGADFEVMNQASIIETASATSRTLTSLLAAIAGVSLIVGGIGIMNIMLVSVTERTREIGIRMSVGARRRDILFQFLAESTILSLIGGAIGIILALGLCGFLARVLSVPTVVNPAVVLGSALFASAVGVFFGWYPARKAAGLYPIDALRFE